MTKEELKAIRDKLGLTQRALAHRAGVMRNTVARHEMGELPIRRYFAVLYRLLARLGETALPIIQAELDGVAPPKLNPMRRRRRKRKRE
jgi:predicted transcriptional regulator